MTNELAEKTLKRIQYGTTYPVYEALDMAIEALKETDMGLNNGDHLHPFGEPFGWTEEEIQKHGLREILKEVDNKNDELSCSESPSRSDDYITIKRQFVLDAIDIGLSGYITDDDKLTLEGMGIAVSEIQSAQPETFEWCHDCKEYDQEQHCCHRWSQQILKTIEELEASYPQEAKDELQYWKERAAKWERDYYITVTGIRKHVPNIDLEEVEEDETD